MVYSSIASGEVNWILTQDTKQTDEPELNSILLLSYPSLKPLKSLFASIYTHKTSPPT